MRYLLSILALAGLWLVTSTLPAADVPPLVVNPATGLNQQLQSSDRLKVPNVANSFFVVTDAQAYDSFYPRAQGVYQSTSADAANLQGILNTYTAVALAPGVTYTGAVILTTGMRIYGLGNGVGALTVAAGSQNVLIRAISSSGGLTFAPGKAITACSFEHIINTATAETGAIVSGCSFNDFNGSTILFDNSSTGSVSNCRFYRFSCTGGPTVISMKGNSTTPNFGNTWMHVNPLTVDSTGPNIYADNYTDLTFIGVDVERYMGASNGPVFQLSTNSGMTRILGVNAGPQSGSFFDTQSSGWFSSTWNTIPPIGVVWATNAGNSFQATDFGQSNDIDNSSGRTRFFAMNNQATAVTVNGVVTPTLSGTQATALAALAYPQRSGYVWGKPYWNFSPPPHVPNDAITIAAAVDSAAYIQGLINASSLATGPAILGPGVWYINSTLTLGSAQGLVGAGKDRTYIVGMNSAIPLMTFSADNFTWRYLGDFTLEGGSAGIATTTSNYIADASYSNICFRDSVTAGVWVNGTGAMDNQTWEHCDFINCGAGVKLTFTDTNQFYDKNFWYHCRFQGCGTGVSMISSRASNMDGWAYCLFADNTTAAVTMSQCTTPFFSNCQFINNAGNPVVSNNQSGLCIGCTFTANGHGTTMTDNFSVFDSTFQRGTSTTANIFTTSTGSKVVDNCTSVDMPVGSGTLANAVMLNTQWAAGDATPPIGIYAYTISGTQTIPVVGTAVPIPQFLRSSTLWSTNLENSIAPDGEPPSTAPLAITQPTTGGVGVGTQTLTGSLIVPVASKPLNQITLGASNYINNPTGLSDGQTISLALTQDATGSRTVTWAPIYCFPGGSAPTLTATAGATDLVYFRYQATSGNLLAISTSLNVKSSAPAGILDTVTASALTAYSVRLLYRNYSGPLVRLQRSNDNAQADFYPPGPADGNGNKFITKAGSGTGPGGSGTTLATWIGSNTAVIVTWYDQTGHGNNATQVTAANCVQLINAGTLNTFGSNACGTTTGTTTSYAMANGAIPDHQNGNAYAVDAVLNPTGSINSDGVLASGSAGSGNYSFQAFILNPLGANPNATIRNDWQGPGDLSATLSGTFAAPMIYTANYDGTAQTLYNNGTSGATQNPTGIGFAPLTGCVFLGAVSGHYNAYRGQVAECIFFGINQSLNTTNRQALTRNQGTAWTISVP